jgi:rare lipoprotein A (peptidoglycan hydrolase)
MEREIVVAWLLPGGDSLALAIYFLLTMLFKLLSASFIASAIAFLPSPAHARCGTASFYGSHGDGFAGRTMANGQPMNPSALITAHPSLPLGTRLKVTNPANGKSIRVVVTDRGPWYGSRILDLSSGAFAHIASLGQGLAQVCYSRV